MKKNLLLTFALTLFIANTAIADNSYSRLQAEQKILGAGEMIKFMLTLYSNVNPADCPSFVLNSKQHHAFVGVGRLMNEITVVEGPNFFDINYYYLDNPEFLTIRCAKR